MLTHISDTVKAINVNRTCSALRVQVNTTVGVNVNANAHTELELTHWLTSNTVLTHTLASLIVLPGVVTRYSK